MGQIASFHAEAIRPAHARPNGVAAKGLAWICGALATGAAVTLAAVLTVVFAATLAVILVLVSALVALCTLALRARRANTRPVLIQARKVGHSWVAYGWDQRAR